MQLEIKFAKPETLIHEACGIFAILCLSTGVAQVVLSRVGVTVRQVGVDKSAGKSTMLGVSCGSAVSIAW